MQLADIQLNSTNTEGFWATAAPGTAQTVTTNVPDRTELKISQVPYLAEEPGRGRMVLSN